MKRNKWFVLWFFVLCLSCIKGQEKKYSFVKENKNVIHNPEALHTFFSVLKNQDKNQINVLHIGDSHLQVNMITDILRTKLQRMFGNAGRGLIVPYKVAGTNSPGDIFSDSKSMWVGKRNSKLLLPQTTGIGGVTIESLDSTAAFSFRIPEKYAFTQMDVFLENNRQSYSLEVHDLTNGEIIDLAGLTSKKDPNVIEVQFRKPVTEVEIVSMKTRPEQTHTTILGINTRNKGKGLIYHSIGVNGAEYFHYNTSEYFNEQTPFLAPDLIIISLGTNEAYRKLPSFDEVSIRQEIDSFIINLKKYNSEIPFLITTPAYTYLNKRQNERLKTVHDILVSYCEKNKIAYWDLQEITGNAYNWKMNNLFAKDLIHFNKEGYQLQGNLLFSALINAYQKYIHD